MMKEAVPIVVVTYNRPACLSRLLKSLDAAHYPEGLDVPLIISVDGGGSGECVEIAENFAWKAGPKEIRVQPHNLGLRNHILQCGRISVEHEAAIVLEEDLRVSPVFYRYATEATAFYRNDAQVASIGLYAYRFNEFCGYPFEPIPDEWDACFMKVPCSCGLVSFGSRWKEFEAYVTTKGDALEECYIPEKVVNWPSHTSWKRLFFGFLAAHDLFIVHPKASFVEPCGDAGTNLRKPSMMFSSLMSLNGGPFRFPRLSQTLNIYDAFMELDTDALQDRLGSMDDCEFDLYGIKPLEKIKRARVLTSRKTQNVERRLQLQCQPLAYNVFQPEEFVPAEEQASCVLNLAKTEAVVAHSEGGQSETLDRFFGVRANPRMRNLAFNLGVEAGRQHFLKLRSVRWAMQVKQMMRKIIRNRQPHQMQ